jgi:predicted PurR-regulated permease PerM
VPAEANKLSFLSVLGSIVLVIASLYWAQAVLLPLALSILITFLLNPAVNALQRRVLGRATAAVVVVVLVSVVVVAVGWVMASQLSSLAHELPKYRGNINEKIGEFRQAGKGGALEKVQDAVETVTRELKKDDGQPRAALKEPVAVVVESASLISRVPSMLEVLAHAGLVFTLVIFMLIERGNLLDRLICLVGYGRLTVTTKALEEAGQRISRYLLVQSIVNAGYGCAVGLGLFLIGLPYALLWGFLAAVLRFIPYVGPALAALLPMALGLAVFIGWVKPLLVVGLFVILELATNMVLEPLLNGRSAGVSQVTLMVAIAFWTWLWGPVGLLLATPLTVCLGVLGKYVPQLAFLRVLVSDETATELNRYYQRLVARDQDEATAIVDEHLKTQSLGEAYDEVLLPALCYARQDRRDGSLTEDEAQFIFRATRKVVDDLDPHPSEASTGAVAAPEGEGGAAPLPKARILGCPARDEVDELALLMFRQLLDPTRYEVELTNAAMLTAEVVSLAVRTGATLVCVGALPPGGVAQARYLCKRLRVRLPNLKIVVGRWGFKESTEETLAHLRSDGIDHVGTSLLETRDEVMRLVQEVSSLTPEAPPTVSNGHGVLQGSVRA